MLRRRVPLAILVPLALLLGLVTATPVAAAETFLQAELSGDQEVPGPGDDNGFAWAEFRIDPETQSLCWFAFWEEITDPTAAHIHVGAAGVAGPPVVTLDLPGPESEACMDGLDQATLQAIVDDPAGYYVNLHNPEFPDGAVRGQLRLPPIPLFAGLSGANEVPGPGDPDAAGTAFLNFEVAAGRLCAEYFLNDAADFTAAHIHEGEAGVAGPPVITLPTAGEDGFAYECLEGLDPALLQAILDDPGAYYVNVHTAEYPDGAARGQLSTEEPPPPPPEQCDPPEICAGNMVRGDYVYTGFAEDLSFTADNQWRSRLFVHGFGIDAKSGIGGLYVIAFSGLVGAVGGEECGYGEPVEIDTGAQSLAGWLADHPLLDAGEITEVTHGGLPGLRVEVTATVPAECEFGHNLIVSPPIDGFYVLDGERVTFIIQEVGDDTVLSIIDNFDGTSMPELLALLDTELRTMAWGDAATPGGGGGGDDDGEVELPDTAMPRPGGSAAWVWALGSTALGMGSLTVATVLVRRRRL